MPKAVLRVHRSPAKMLGLAIRRLTAVEFLLIALPSCDVENLLSVMPAASIWPLWGIFSKLIWFGLMVTNLDESISILTAKCNTIQIITIGDTGRTKC